MMLKKRSRITAILFTLLLSVTLLFSSVITVFADGGVQDETFESYAAAHNQELIEAGVISENLTEIFTNPAFIGETDNGKDVKLVLAEFLVNDILVAKKAYRSTYGDISALFEPHRVANVQNLFNEAMGYCTGFSEQRFSGLNYADAKLELEEAKADMDAKIAEMVQIKTDDENAYNEKVASIIEELTNKYNERKALAETGFESLVQDEYNAQVAKINGLTYDAPQIVQLTADLEAYKDLALIAIGKAPINDIEHAMILYHDWLSVAEGDKFASDYTGAVKEKVDALTPVARRAKTKYENNSEFYKSYNAEYKLLVAYLENIDADPLWTPPRRESIQDKEGVITITALDSAGNEIKAFPEACDLRIYQTKNSAAKRNASLLLKEQDKELSVAYFISIWIENGIHKYELPSKIVVFDENGNTNEVYVTYEITFDVNKYYEKYLKDSKGKLLIDNINDAIKHLGEVEGEKPAISYGYKAGNDNLVDLKQITFEGGVLVFRTNSHLNSFFLAGVNLESYITSPIFWLVVVAAFILLIIIIKFMVKHWKYVIRFKTNGGSSVGRVRASKGEYFVLPEPPVKDGYVFAGWFIDKALKVRFIGNCMTRRRSFKLYAKWAAPVPRERLLKFYDVLRDTMCSYKKESFKSLLGLAETEFIASMAMRDNYLQLNLALNPEVLRKEGISVLTAKEKRYAEVPAQVNISTEESFAQALDLTKRVLLNKGLQPIEDYVPAPASTEEERKRGFAFIIHNERVAKTAEDYFELLRIAVKSYVLENDLGKFKPGDKVTLARIYITNEVACLHLPKVKGVKGLKGSKRAPFADTPVICKILAPRDMLEAYALIDKVMKANGFVKRPENANDLVDVKVPATNGFAYTLIF